MQQKNTLFTWLEENRDMWIEALRLYLGIALILKGIQFIYNKELAQELISEVGLPFLDFFIMHVIVLMHVAGGFLLMIGLLTRIAALVQIPILLGAIFFIHLRQGFFQRSADLELVIIVLFLLIVFVGYGGGRLSVDYVLKRRSVKT
jgi:putative oxidoreductase